MSDFVVLILGSVKGSSDEDKADRVWNEEVFCR